MNVHLALTTKNLSTLGNQFRQMSQQAKREREREGEGAMQIHLALMHSNVWMFHDELKELGDRAMRIHLTAHGPNAGFKDYLKEQGRCHRRRPHPSAGSIRRIPELFPEVVEEMKLHLAGTNGQRYVPTETMLSDPRIKDILQKHPDVLEAIKKDEEAMRIYLSRACTGLWKPVQEGAENGGPLSLAGCPLSLAGCPFSLAGCGKFYVLESFAYIKPNDVIVPLIPFFKGFLLDSGAFTFMARAKGPVDFDEYLRRYIAFIKKHDIQHFFELDIDSVVGYEKVKEYRRILERETGRRCIPVWHRARGKEDFLRMCDEYDYVAIGGIVTKEIKPSEHRYFPWFIREAHKRGAKIHGLGYTNLSGLSKYHFDSVDSSSWTSGNRFGHLYKFTGRGLQQIHKPPGTRVKARITAINNFVEWVKFSEWAETHL